MHMVKGVVETELNIRDMGAVLDLVPGGTLVYKMGDNKDIIYSNNSILDLFECSTIDEFNQLSGGSFKNLIHSEDYPIVEKNVETQKRAGTDVFGHVKFRVNTKNGRVKYVEGYGKSVLLKGVGEVCVAFIVDMDIKYLSYDVDKLTGLPGQKRFNEFAAKVIRLSGLDPNTPDMVFLYFNICRFKMLNVKFGVEQGDIVLKNVASVLKEEFRDDYVSRFSNDHFALLTANVDIDKKIKNIFRKLRQIPEVGMLMDCSVGAYILKDHTVSPELACSYAKIACDSIKNGSGSSYIYYNEEIGRKINLQYYVVNNLKKAIKNGYIKIYFQPVIRALSGDLCGMEALARWDDPDMGFLNPYDFISALEDARIIHELDSYMVKRICMGYQKGIKKNKPLVPVSFNLSRLDFVLTDIKKIIDNAVAEYEVPRDMLNIEITESMFVEDSGSIKKEIDKFHRSGYKVWMDDFGSGYSSLNLLKDFDFDELKIDMLFLSNFNQKAKEILKSTIRMAKNIDIQTLAEGVENREQYEFLRDIGCEKIQGYYFGRPQPYDEMIENWLKKGGKIESRAWADYFDRIGKENLLTDKPLALLEDDGKEFKFYFLNNAFKEALKSNGSKSMEEVLRDINEVGTPMQRMFRNFAENIRKNKTLNKMTYPSGDQFMSLTAREIAKCNGVYMYALNLTNITRNDEKEEADRNDGIIRNALYLFDSLSILDLEADNMETFNTINGESVARNTKLIKGIKENIQKFKEIGIYREDREDFENFADIDSLKKRIEDSKNGYITDYFRTKESRGDFSWYAHTIMVIPRTNYNKFFVFTQKAGFENPYVRRRLGNKYHREYQRYMPDGDSKMMIPIKEDTGGVTEKLVWENLMDFSEIKYFWKDKNRRFVGASNSFLDYYGFKSDKDIIGKTDEDMKWHVSEAPYKNDEEEVISTGKFIRDVPGKCIIKGKNHNIRATKFPIYKDGKIVGLLGYFIDADKEMIIEDKMNKYSGIDPITGLSNIKGMLEDFGQYADAFKMAKKDFVVFSIKVSGQETIYEAYGKDTGDKLLNKIGAVIMECFGSAASIGRLYGGNFVVFYNYQDQLEVYKLAEKVTDEILSINKVDDYSCTCFPRIKKIYASETAELEAILKKLLN